MKNITIILALFIFNFSYSQNWLQTGGGASHDEAFDVETDAYGNVYTTGYVSSTLQMGTSLNIQTIGFSDIYVSKSNANGDFLWVKTFGGPGADRGYDLTVDNTGNIYLTGYVTGTVIFDSITLTTNDNSQDFFVAKLNPNGDVLWVNVEGGADGENGFGIAVDSQSNVVVTGQFKGSATIGGVPVNSVYNPDELEFSTDIFIVKYAADGSPLWTRTGAAINDDRGLAVDINNDDEILLTGQFSDTLTIAGQTFNNDIVNAGYLLKMDQSGNNIWFRTMGAYQTMVYDVEVDDERVYVTGDFLGQMAIFGSPEITFLSGNYQYKIFVVRFDQSGNVAWTHVDASDSQISSKAIALDANRDVYVAGTFKCTFSDYADSLGGTGQFNSVGYRDVFVSKYLQDNGSRAWMRQIGGPGQDYCSGIGINQIDNPVLAGSYETQLSMPVGTNFIPNLNNYYIDAYSCGNNLSYQSVWSTGFKDIFITKPVDLNLDNYYYYITGCYDVMTPSIATEDTLTFCGSGNLVAQTFTDGGGANQEVHSGPYFSFDWNTGEDNSSIEIENTGWYSCQIDRLDGCSSTTDSVFVQINPIPQTPPMTDEFGINVEEENYQNISVCYPDSAWVTFDIDSTLTNTFGGTIVTYQDTMILSADGQYNFNVENEFGCSSSENFAFNYIYAALDTMVPYLTLPSGLDSITICENSTVTLNCLDSLTNPSLNPNIPFETYVYPGGNEVELDTTFQPSTTGWYTITYHPILGYSNLCGEESQSYEVSATIHVTINPNPEVNFVLGGITPFCPGDTSNVWTSETYPGLSWSGPGIVDINEDGDSILAIQAGTYHYSGTVVDTLTGCETNMNTGFSLNYKDDPLIWSNVEDNLICPGDSLLLTCDPGLEYTWVGPMGQVIGNTQSIWVDLPGFYHCVLLDNDGCLLTSNTLELLEYNSPYLIPEPGIELCHTGSIEITVMHSGSPDFYWLDPINSNESVVVLEDPGTYTCEITQCGFTVSQSITIEDSGFEATINALDTLLCEGEDFVLTSNEGMSTYEWSNGVVTLSNQMVVSEPGTYDVFVTSSNGCTAQSESITVSYYDFWEMPVSESVEICNETSAILSVQGTGVFTWYDSTMTNVLAIADTFETPVLNQPMSYFVIASDSLCTSSPVQVDVSIAAASITPQIQADSVYCEGENVVLTSNGQGNFLWTLPDSTTSTDEQLVVPNVSLNDQGTFSLQTSNGECASDVASIELVVDPMVSIDLIYQDSVICQDSLLLTAQGDYSSIQWMYNQQIIAEGDSTMWSSLVGYYQVMVENENGTCSAWDEVLLTNNSSIEAPDLSDENACSGQSLEIYLGLDNVFWATDPQLSDIQFSDTIYTGVLTDDVIYYVGQIDEGGCYSEVSMLNVEVTTSPAPNITYNDPVCEGEDLIISTDLPNSAIEWTLPDSTTILASTLIIEGANELNQGIYSAMAIDNECITETGSIDVIVHSNPEPPVILGETEYCQGDTVFLEYENYQVEDSTWWYSSEYFMNTAEFVLVDAQNSFTVNAFYTDGICFSDTTLNVVVNANPVVGDLLTNSPVCVGDELALSIDSVAGWTYIWSGPMNFSSGSSQSVISSATINQAGEYMVEVTDQNGCSAKNSIDAQVLLYPVVDLGEDTIICPGVPILLSVDPGYDSYQWNTGDFGNELLVEEPGTYSVEVANGSCWTTDEIEIIGDCDLVFAPNIITPNGDNYNDKLYFVSPMIKTINVYVYNRWGNLVGEWHDLDGYWDGKHYLTGEDLAEGSYYYVLDYIDIKGEEHKIKSYITLIR